MGTPYQDIFDIFIRKVTDHDFLSLPDEDIENYCFGYLKSAIMKFKKSKIDLTDRDDNLMQFNSTLGDEEQEILGLLMIVEWLNPQIYNIMNVKQFLGDKDFRYYSQANHLEKIMMLRDKSKEDAEREVINYTYETFDLGGLNSD